MHAAQSKQSTVVWHQFFSTLIGCSIEERFWDDEHICLDGVILFPRKMDVEREDALGLSKLHAEHVVTAVLGWQGGTDIVGSLESSPLVLVVATNLIYY